MLCISDPPEEKTKLWIKVYKKVDFTPASRIKKRPETESISDKHYINLELIKLK